MKKSQSILEYALLIGVVATAFILMSTKFARAIKSKINDASEQLGGEYEPGLTKISHTISVTRASTTSNTITTKPLTMAEFESSGNILQGGYTETTVVEEKRSEVKETSIKPLEEGRWHTGSGIKTYKDLTTKEE